MKNKIVLGLAAAIISCTTVSHADFSFRTATNNCSGIAGKWSGKGKIFNILLGTCQYHGSGEVNTPDANGKFNFHASIDKDSGSFICPEHTNFSLPGNCENGVVTLRTQYGNLNGNVNGGIANAKGTVTVSPGIDADISLQIQKVG